MPDLPDGDAPVFFVVVHGKPDTRRVRNVLDAHPEVLCRSEGRFFGRDFVRAVPTEDPSRGWLTLVQPTSLYGAFSSSSELRTWIERSVWTDGEEADEHLANPNHLATNYFLTRRLSQTTRRIVGDKTSFAGGGELDEIGTLYSEAKVIHVIRDGRDVAVSMIHHMWNYSRDTGAFYDLELEDLKRRDAYRRATRTRQTEPRASS